MRQINRLLAFYLIALSILLVSVLTSLVVTDRMSKRLEGDAARINVSGRQRMLSQRIIYLAQDLVLSPDPEIRAQLTQTIADFEAGIDLFARSHAELSGAPDLEASLASLYFGDGSRQSLDARVREYIRLARAIARNPADAESLAGLKRIERGGLLRDLDRVVSEIENISVAKLERMRQIEFVSLVIALLIVLIEVLLVFLPGHRLIRRTLRDLKQRNAEVEDGRRQVEDRNAELRQSADLLDAERSRLVAALEESEALRREQAEFTYSVSHDLKSPANTIRMLLDEIALEEGEKFGPESREMLEHAQFTVRRMGGQIEDVLTYAWSTGASEEASDVDLGKCLETVLADVKGEIDASGARIHIGPMATVFGYPKQLAALLQNLLTNALKYRAPDVRPEIRIACETGDADEIVLSISDNGIGIAPEHHARIFGLFQRLHRHDEFSGSGLGLCTCLRVAQNHSGRIGLTSAPGEGATFTVVLRSAAAVNRSHGSIAA